MPDRPSGEPGATAGLVNPANIITFLRLCAVPLAFWLVLVHRIGDAFLLFGAYLDEVKNYMPSFSGNINLNKPEVFVGAMLGAVLVFIFSSLAIKAVGTAAYAIINNVRQQFKNNPGIMLGTSKPNYGECVDIATKAALGKMVAPGLLVVGMTIGVGLAFRGLYHAMGQPPEGATGAEVVGGFLMVGTITGILTRSWICTRRRCSDFSGRISVGSFRTNTTTRGSNTLETLQDFRSCAGCIVSSSCPRSCSSPRWKVTSRAAST